MGINNFEDINDRATEMGFYDGKPVKKIKNNGGLIERVNIERVVLTEDNKQLLTD